MKTKILAEFQICISVPLNGLVKKTTERLENQIANLAESEHVKRKTANVKRKLNNMSQIIDIVKLN